MSDVLVFRQGPAARNRRLDAQATLGDRLSHAALAPRDWAFGLMGMTYRTFVGGLRRLPPAYLEWEGRARARRAFLRAAARVPAYRAFLCERARPGVVPETDKDSYVKKFSIAARCVDGRIPGSGVAIDESSGSTGVPFNWVRGAPERRHAHRLISHFASYCFGTRPRITINAFSMGAWATGINMGLALERTGIVKNTGPDVAKILHTLRVFGTGHDYLVAGYPPFLKRLIDEAADQGFPLAAYRLNGFVGGEGMSEGLRDYLQGTYLRVYSGYGATDLEIAIAGETPVSVAIRRLARNDGRVRRALFGRDPRLPMVFQYLPITHHIEVNGAGELLVTITRGDLLAPRIRYNVHDQGGVARYDEMAARLAGHDVNIETLGEPSASPRLRLPFVWVFGRRDYTVSVMGANIYPEDIEHCLYAEPELARRTRSFCLSLSESEEGRVRPCFHFEVEEPADALKQRFESILPVRLQSLNADYRVACAEYPEAMIPEIRLHRVGEGPFAGDGARIKQLRVLR